MHLLNSLKVAVGDHKKQHSMMLSFCYLFLLLNLIMYQVFSLVSPRELRSQCTFAIAGMSAKHDQNASKRKRSDTVKEDDDSPSWLIPDILLLIMMRLGIVDFLAFSGVCKLWRTIALTNRKEFLLSRQRMAIRISTRVANRKECWLEDCDGRVFRTILPRSSGRTCVGLVSGYVILFGRKTRDFRLVNPITRHEVNFPRFPFHVVVGPNAFQGTLVFSRTADRWVFVISSRHSRTVSFSFNGKRGSWTHLSSDVPISDLAFFKGKIYTLNKDIGLCEVRLGPNPTLTPLKMKNSLTSHVLLPEFGIFGEKLFVTGYRPYDPFPVEVDVDEVRWVIKKPEFCEDPDMLYRWVSYINRSGEGRKTRVINMPYFPHECWDANILHE
ncbi:putative F-box protein [Helianthus annuus]|nr:putative F-box protein [Helianthus annuus]KAJ0443919.1 putative F-box domain-containing protein [Helianthus annuus]KAJ0461328.1 putative F-box protein [Helianthus annuus]KAJ0641754.1 putative F-box protein [Helianthus annuus]KAJ0645634.1 putative F-box protein [Helianthus annuus]